MAEHPPEPPENLRGTSLPARILRGLGRAAAGFAAHLLMYVVLGLLIGMGLWLIGIFDMPEALIVGAVIIIVMVMFGAMS